jgi:hypothetical protein
MVICLFGWWLFWTKIKAQKWQSCFIASIPGRSLPTWTTSGNGFRRSGSRQVFARSGRPPGCRSLEKSAPNSNELFKHWFGGSMLRLLFRAFFAYFRRKKWRISLKPMWWAYFCTTCQYFKQNCHFSPNFSAKIFWNSQHRPLSSGSAGKNVED